MENGFLTISPSGEVFDGKTGFTISLVGAAGYLNPSCPGVLPELHRIWRHLLLVITTLLAMFHPPVMAKPAALTKEMGKNCQ